MRVFLDTNVLVSAFFTRGLCTELFLTLAAEHDPIIGEVVLDELERVLRTKFRTPAADINDLQDALRRFEVAPRPPRRDTMALHDESDRWILASAKLAKAEVLVTGDKELLALGDLADLRIRSPRSLWQEVRRQPDPRRR